MMKGISKLVYENLTPEQRMRAVVSAIAREDEAEVRRLRDTCPKYMYHMTDVAFTGRMEALYSLSLTVECAMRGLVIDYLVALRFANGPAAQDPEVLRESMELTEQILIAIASTDEAWRQALLSVDIDTDAMDKVGAPRDEVTKDMVYIAQELSEPAPQLVQEILQAMRERLASHAC